MPHHGVGGPVPIALADPSADRDDVQPRRDELRDVRVSQRVQGDDRSPDRSLEFPRRWQCPAGSSLRPPARFGEPVASFHPVPVWGVLAAGHHEGDERDGHQDEDELDSVAHHHGTGTPLIRSSTPTMPVVSKARPFVTIVVLLC